MCVYLVENIQKLEGFDFFGWIIAGFMLIGVITACAKIITEFSVLIKKPIGSAKQRKEDHELLIQTAKNLSELQELHNKDNNECVKHDEEIRDDLKKLTTMFVNKEIADFRWYIINFATRVSEGKPCNKESYKHCLKTYHDYEQLLKEYGLENGEVKISMEIISEAYKEKMKNGEF